MKIHDNITAGTGMANDEVPTTHLLSVLMRDGSHAGTLITRTDGNRYGFSSLDSGTYHECERAALVEIIDGEAALILANFVAAGTAIEQHTLAILGCDFVDDLVAYDGLRVIWDSAKSSEIREICLEFPGKKIQAIKAVRNRMGLKLQDAKIAVDAVWVDLYPPHVLIRTICTEYSGRDTAINCAQSQLGLSLPDAVRAVDDEYARMEVGEVSERASNQETVLDPVKRLERALLEAVPTLAWVWYEPGSIRSRYMEHDIHVTHVHTRLGGFIWQGLDDQEFIDSIFERVRDAWMAQMTPRMYAHQDAR